ncbi:hypothetical protein ACJBP2_10665, partial [Streptococcus suis]
KPKRTTTLGCLCSVANSTITLKGVPHIKSVKFKTSLSPNIADLMRAFSYCSDIPSLKSIDSIFSTSPAINFSEVRIQ